VLGIHSKQRIVEDLYLECIEAATKKAILLGDTTKKYAKNIQHNNHHTNYTLKFQKTKNQYHRYENHLSGKQKQKYITL